jgi:general secretion pathway protein J
MTHARRGGFTLVEVLVALVIMAVLAAMAWQGVDGIARSRGTAQARMEQTLRLTTVLAQWEYDLQEVQDTYGAVPSFAFDGATLRLVRRAEGGVQLVAWSLRGGDWLRWASAPVTRAAELQEQWMRSQQLLGNEPGQLRTLAGVASWQLYCFRSNAWSNCQSSADVAPAGPSASAPQRDVLPSGVRLVLTLPEGALTRSVALGPQER